MPPDHSYVRAEPGVNSNSARVALRAIAPDFKEIATSDSADRPLGWDGYADRISEAEHNSGEREAVLVAEGEVGGRRATLISFDFNFLGGSMGEEAGRRIAGAFMRALRLRQPVVSLVATGGARVQERMRALVQMQRITGCVVRARQAGLLHISVVRHPTTGGVWVSLVSAADVIVGVDGASASFAGRRVRAIDTDADDAFSVAGKLRDGFVDAVAQAHEIPSLVAQYVRLLASGRRDPEAPALPEHVDVVGAPVSGWAAVARARNPGRPRAPRYLSSYFDEYVAISGDRCGGRDPGMLCGFGARRGTTIAYAAQTGRANNPSGFRTAARLLRLADRLRVPVLTLIDTPGAQHDGAAERSGIGHAIADTFAALAEITVPVTSVLIGEGGSGGALALVSPGNLWATPDSYFSVIAPEAAASIVFRDAGRAREAAEQLELGPDDLVRAGIARGITPGPKGAAPSGADSVSAL